MPDHPARPAIRASDADRERVVGTMREHLAAGRLTVDEFSERTDAAYAATTVADLQPLLADLPDDVAVEEEARSPEEIEVRSGLRDHLVKYGAVMLLLVAIWTVTGASYFWPVWPALGWGIAVAIDVMNTRREIETIRATSAEERPAIAARSAERRRGDGHHGWGHSLPHSSRHSRR